LTRWRAIASPLTNYVRRPQDLWVLPRLPTRSVTNDGKPMRNEKGQSAFKNIAIIIIGMLVFILFLALLVIAERFLIGQV
jgi:hypothetical protein